MKWFLLLCILMATPGIADHIDAKKDQLVRISLDQEDSLSPGDRVFVLDSQGKKKGIVRIEKVKGNRAFGRIQKGIAEKNMAIQMARGAPKVKSEPVAKPRKKRADEMPLSLGAMVGIGFDSMTVIVAPPGMTSETVAMNGAGFSAKAMVDYNFTSYLGIRILTGMEQFTTKGNSDGLICDSTQNCKTEISYITFDGWLRYAVYDMQHKVWLGAGFGLLMPGAKSTNTLDSNSIATTSILYIGAGGDIFIEEDMFVPTQLEYGLLPSSDQVTASIFAIRAGIGFRF